MKNFKNYVVFCLKYSSASIFRSILISSHAYPLKQSIPSGHSLMLDIFLNPASTSFSVKPPFITCGSPLNHVFQTECVGKFIDVPKVLLPGFVLSNRFYFHCGDFSCVCKSDSIYAFDGKNKVFRIEEVYFYASSWGFSNSDGVSQGWLV